MMFIRPCEGRITSPFGMRTHPVTGKPSTMHWGIDVAKSGAVPILAAADGTVSRVQKDGTFGTYGNLIMIVHTIGGKVYETVYAHLHTYNVKVGQSLRAGQTIGLMGNTGGSTGQHLHFEVHLGRWNNKYSNVKNPAHYMINPEINAPTAPPKKEETRMFNPSSPTLKKSVIDKIEAATKTKMLNDGKWLAQAKSGTLSLDDALALSVYIDSTK